MTRNDEKDEKTDFLFELGTAELPSQYAQRLSQALRDQITQALQESGVRFSEICYYVTPRRLAVLISAMDTHQLPCRIERQGPSIESAFDKAGTPTLACISFARSCGVTADTLLVQETPKGKRVYCHVESPGKKTAELLPALIKKVIHELPLYKSMRWGSSSDTFIRPVLWVLALLGNDVIPISLFGLESSDKTYGHRFHHPGPILVYEPHRYEQLLKTKGYVIADIIDRKRSIVDQIQQIQQINPTTHVIIDEKLLDEITGLVEWPVVLVGHYKKEFLDIPAEALITAMKVHQKCFPVLDKNTAKLQSQFIMVSNIHSANPAAIISGNERVMNARLADAAFFYHQDLKHHPDVLNQKLNRSIFEKTLGTVGERVQRLIALSDHMATALQENNADAQRAAELSKFDLMSQMVSEFPELQGVMGFYYAKKAGEKQIVAKAIQEHYYPRFSGDQLPESKLGILVALADRLDLLCGIIGIGKSPRSDKDPYGLRRAALGIIRILIEKNIPLDLKDLITLTLEQYGNRLSNKTVMAETLAFITDRLRAWYMDQAVSPQIFAAVQANQTTLLSDFDQRLKAVQAFQALPAAATLSAANKRVDNVLKKIKNPIVDTIPIDIDPQLLETSSERHLVTLLTAKKEVVDKLYRLGHYTQALTELASLKQPVDHFFTHVMIMVDDLPLRNNRLAILVQLRNLFTQIADLSLL